jgi:predicted transcriptional regulator
LSEPATDEVKQKILQHLQRVKQGISRDIAKATGLDKRTVDKALSELTYDGKLIYVNYGGVTYVALPGSVQETAG